MPIDHGGAAIGSDTQAGSEARLSQVVVARTVDEVESLRKIWETAGVSDLDSDIDYFLTVVRYGSFVVRPHVVLIRRPGRPALMAIRAGRPGRRISTTCGRTTNDPYLTTVRK